MKLKSQERIRMLISPIIRNRVLYICLHAEQSFYGTFLADTLEIKKDIITGIYDDELSKTVFDNIKDYIEENKEKYDSLVLDFDKLKSVQKNLDSIISSIIKLVNTTVLVNIHHIIIHKLSLEEYTSINNLNDVYYKYFYIQDSSNLSIELDIRSVFEVEFGEKLADITTKNSLQLHHSSSVYLTQFIDIKKLIVSHKYFFIYSLYWLSLDMLYNDKKSWNVKKRDNKVLVCQNLNSSFITSILSSFLLIDLITLDHIGPINKVYNEIEKKFSSKYEYIIVSDVVCLGTEVRIAKNLIEFSGGKYIGNVCIIRIMTMLEIHRYKDTASIFEITDKNNPINFKIETALTINNG